MSDVGEARPPTEPAPSREGFDVIGDVHGCYAQLVALLSELGYDDRDGHFHHAVRRAVFVGDLIDRGPDQVGVVQLVRSMVDAGSALVVMGNHEFNAIAFATRDPRRPGEFLRPHTTKNVKQHAQFLVQFGENSADHRGTIDWFRSLPLWLDLGDLRIVHACWDPGAMVGLGSPQIDDDLLVASSTPGAPEFEWVEHLCKGPELELPDGRTFLDNHDHPRSAARFRWWDPTVSTYRDACEVPPSQLAVLPDAPIPALPVEPYQDTTPVLYGHYWRQWEHREVRPTTACVDYSCVVGGPLVAYRWSGEAVLDVSHLVAAGGGR